MPYPLNNNDVLLFTIVGKQADQTILNTFHYLYQGATAIDGAAKIRTFMNSFQALVVSKLRDATSNDFKVQELWGQKVYPSRWAKEIKAINETGNVLQPALPPNDAASIQRGADEADRRGLQGRVQIAGVPRTGVEGGVLLVAQMALLQPIADALKSEIFEGDFGDSVKPILFDRRADPAKKRPVTRSYVKPEVRVMRRRTVGRGI